MAVDLSRDAIRSSIPSVLRWVVRLYLTVVVGVSVYSVVWLLELAEVIDSNTLTTVWFALVGMGVAFVVILLPAFWNSRDVGR